MKSGTFHSYTSTVVPPQNMLAAMTPQNSMLFRSAFGTQLSAIEYEDEFKAPPTLDQDGGDARYSRSVNRALFILFNLARWRTIQLVKMFESARRFTLAVEIASWRAKSFEMRDEIAERNIGLVYKAVALSIAHGYNIDRDDAQGVASVTLLRAIPYYDVSKQANFATYAMNAMMREISRESNRHARVMVLDEKFVPERGAKCKARELDDDKEERAAIMRAIAVACSEVLTDREREIIEARFFPASISGESPRVRTLDEIGERIKLTKERVRQIEAVALEKIRAAIGVEPDERDERQRAPDTTPSTSR